MKNFLLAFAVTICCIATSQAQTEPRTTVNDYLNAYVGTNAKPYIQPLVDLVTTNIHTGVWDWAAIPKDDFYFRIKANGMLSFPTDEMRTFQGSTSGNFTPQQTMTVPTVIGDEQPVVVQGTDNTTYVFPGGYDLNQVALATPQATIGGFLNSELSARFLSFPLNNDTKVRFYGLGARHSLSNYFTNPALDVSVGYFYHHIEAESYLNSDQHLFSLMLGKSGKILSSHLSGSYQIADHKLHYTYENGAESTEVNLDMQNSNPWMIEAGLGAKLGPVFLNTALSYSDFWTLGLGAGLTF